MKSLTEEEKNLIVEALEYYSDIHNWNDLPIDDNGKHYDDEPDSYDAQCANIISDIFDKI